MKNIKYIWTLYVINTAVSDCQTGVYIGSHADLVKIENIIRATFENIDDILFKYVGVIM